MKKIVIVVIIVFIVITGWYYFNNESMPDVSVQKNLTGEISPADMLANKMLQAIGKDKWDDIHYVQWTFRDKRHFVWDKYEHFIQVKWEDYELLIDPNKSQGIAYKESSLVEGVEGEKLVNKAIDYFNNDSFWLNAPAKVFDYGTERSINEHNGQEALMVKYTTGGSTPGDSYMWILDENGKPKAWKMWVSNIPVGGMELTWEEWGLYDGAELSQFHKGEVFDVRISNIKTGMTLADLGLEAGVFTELGD